MMLRVLDLFSGIGGFSLGLEKTGGFRTVAFCEIDKFCQRVLRKHWPEVPIYDDIRTVPQCAADVVTGGFPCQPFSSAAAGRRRGMHFDGGLWSEMCRVVSECQPTWVIVENVINFDRLALERVVSDLEKIGYEVAPPLEIPACAVGHKHWRARLWILGHADRDGKPKLSVDGEMARLPQCYRVARELGADDGISGRMDRRRLSALGNSIVPQIPELIGRAILSALPTPAAAVRG